MTKVMLDLAYVTNPTKFIEHIIEEQGLDKNKVLVRVWLDGGQGSFKVVVSIFETDYDLEITFSTSEGAGTRLTGSNRLLVMAMAENMQELYGNLWIVVEKLQLNSIECCFAIDLKLIIVILGILSHSGYHACPYCYGTMSLQVGTMRTFRNMAEWFEKFKSAGLHMKYMQLLKLLFSALFHFRSCISLWVWLIGLWNTFTK